MKNYLFLAFCLISFSCTNSRENEIAETIHVQDIAKKSFKLYDFVTEVELISLESQGFESLVGIVLKFDVISDSFIILSTTPSGRKNIQIFEIDGKLKKSFISIETDYSEPIGIDDYLIFDNKIGIIGLNNKLYYLNHEFQIESERDLGFKSDVTASTANHILVYTNQKAIDFQADSLLYELLLFDKSFNLIKKHFKFNPVIGQSRYHSKLSHNIQPAEKGFLFTKFMSDTIYQVSDEGVSMKYFVDFGTKAFNIREYPDLILKPFSPILTEKFSWGVSNPLETKQGIFFEYYDKEWPLGVYFDPINDEGMIFNPFDILSDENIVPWPKYYDGEFFYGILTEEGMGFVNSNTVDRYSSESIVKKIYQFVQENTNPVIVKYKLDMP